MAPRRRPSSGIVVAVAAVAALALGALTIVAFRSGSSPAAAGSGAGATVSGAAAAGGADLFRAKGCGACHDGPGSDSAYDVGPNLNYLSDVAALRVAGLDAAAYVRQSIEAPQAFTVAGYGESAGMGTMPSLPLSPAEVEALVAWLLA